MPFGHYIGLKRDFSGARWKVGTWNMPEVESTYLEYNEWVEQSLTPATREIILAIKKANIQNKWDLPGITIYNAVLTDKVKTMKSFNVSLWIVKRTIKRRPTSFARNEWGLHTPLEGIQPRKQFRFLAFFPPNPPSVVETCRWAVHC